MKIVYGHTDSIYVECDSIEKSMEVCEYLNTEIQKLFPNVFDLDAHPVQLEFEKYYKSLGVGTTKNRNAGLINWKDGEFLDEEEFVMTGFTAKRVSETTLAKETQIGVLTMWVNGNSEEEITQDLHEKYWKVAAGNIPLEDIIKRSRFRPERFTVECANCKKNHWKSKYTLNQLVERKANGRECCDKPNYVTIEGKRPMIGGGLEGVLFYNHMNPIPITDSYIYYKIEPAPVQYLHPFTGRFTQPKYLSAETLDQLKGYGLSPDWGHYAETVLKKAEPIYRAMGWDLMAIKRDSGLSDLAEWI